MKIEMKIEEVLYHKVDFYELDRVINEFYKPNEEWDFVSDNEANNDSSYVFNVNGKFDDYEEKRLEKFKKDSISTSWMTRTLLDDLCRQGLIPIGPYLVKVCW